MTVLFVLLEFASPSKNVHILWFDYPANTNVLVSLVSFGVSGIYLFVMLLDVVLSAHLRDDVETPPRSGRTEPGQPEDL